MDIASKGRRGGVKACQDGLGPFFFPGFPFDRGEGVGVGGSKAYWAMPI